MLTITQRELSSEETRLLRQRLLAFAIFFVIAGILTAVFFTKAQFDFSGPELYPLLAFGLFFVAIIVYMVLGVTRDLYAGVKQVITGEVTDKQRHKSSKTKGRGKTSSGSKPKYYLYFGDKKYYVEHEHYKQVSVGDEVELHYAQYAGLSLDLVNLSREDKDTPKEEEKSLRDQLREWTEHKESLSRKELVMSHADIKLLRKHRNKAMGTHLSLTFIGAFMFLAFLLGTLLWWVMVFPCIFLFLWVVFFSARAFKTHKQYRKEVALGVKVAVKTKILDKQKHTGSGKGYFVITDLGMHTIDKAAYELLDTQEDAIVFVGKTTNWLIEIQTKALKRALD